MATIGSNLTDSDGRQYKDVVGEDSSGNKYVLITNSSGQQEVVLVAGSARLGIVLDDPHEVPVAKAIDAADGAYAANDTVSDDNCCTTATAWEFAGMANATGGYGEIISATIFSETPNISPRLTGILFNATPTRGLTDNSPCNVPAPGDMAKYLGETAWPALDNVAANVASTAVISPSTVGNLPLRYKCATGSTSIFLVLKTLDIFTQIATNDITIVYQIRHL